MLPNILCYRLTIYFVLTFTVTRILRYVERRLDQDTYTQRRGSLMTETILEIKNLKKSYGKMKSSKISPSVSKG